MTAALAMLSVAVSAHALSGASARAARTVDLRGTAYEFNQVTTRLAGATVRVAEFPRITATVRRDGTYDLRVPDRARVTPYIVAPGYHTIYLQTFTTDGQDLSNVNSQTPSDAIYGALAALLRVPLDAHGSPVGCAIVSTFSTRNVRDLSFAGFIAYGAHGVPGATATPALRTPVYFNANVIPDPAQTVSSKDGGVIWTRVPTGVYLIRARHPVKHFASFVATCRPGRIVNASPPWGLSELGLPNPTRVSATWSVHAGRVALRSLTARGLPPGAVVRVRCSGPRCGFTAATFRPTATTFDIRHALGKAALGSRVDQTLEVTVTAHAFTGLVVRWTIAAGRAPAPQRLCVPLGLTRPQRACS